MLSIGRAKGGGGEGQTDRQLQRLIFRRTLKSEYKFCHRDLWVGLRNDHQKGEKNGAGVIRTEIER